MESTILAAGAAALVSFAVTATLTVRSIIAFSRTGPQLKNEALTRFGRYSAFAICRLAAWTFFVLFIMAALGVLVYGSVAVLLGTSLRFWPAVAAAALGTLSFTAIQFCRHLLYYPSSLVASLNYRPSRLYPLWQQLGPRRLMTALVCAGLVVTVIPAMAAVKLARAGALGPLVVPAIFLLLVAVLVFWAFRIDEPRPRRARRASSPNILMIGSDTLRADRVGAAGYYRSLTPNLDALARRGTQFTECYVPCARTAPSLISLFTGVWPHRHGVRDNFVSSSETTLTVPALPKLLAERGYSTAAISDWAGSDLAKFDLGFETLDVPSDQWNIKYLIRQGPKDLRLFLTLFTRNRFGKAFLPELYYLAGIPLTRDIGRATRRAISALSQGDKPFFINAFMAATHPPFGSDHPYYTMFANPDYEGPSKFAMARLSDPFDIIRRQGDSRKEFDLDQIIDLYDGCVRSFDDELARILEFVAASGLADNTIVVVYSDHGMELFEHESWGQGNSVVGDFSPKIPLVITDPRQAGGNVVRNVVRSIDIAPTLLDMIGAKVPPTMDGVSLLPWLSGDDAGSDLIAYNETGIWLTQIPGMPDSHLLYPDLSELLEVPDAEIGTLAVKPEYRGAIIRAKDRMVRAGRWKLTYQPLVGGPLYRLHDLTTDPDCRIDVARQVPEVFERLKAHLDAMLSEDPALNCEANH